MIIFGFQLLNNNNNKWKVLNFGKSIDYSGAVCCSITSSGSTITCFGFNGSVV